jgi:hypothetical protein
MRNGTFIKKCLPIVKKISPNNYYYYYTPFKEIKKMKLINKKSMNKKKKLVYMENTICLLLLNKTP